MEYVEVKKQVKVKAEVKKTKTKAISF